MTAKEFKSKIKSKMKKVGTYNIAFEFGIDKLADALADYEKAQEAFAESGGKFVISFTNKAGAENMVKNPYYGTIEKLRADILAYMRELGITPAGQKKASEKGMADTKGNSLAAMLKKLE